MASRFVTPFFDVGGGITPSDGALLEFFITGTSTPKDTFTTEALNVANTNPVVADANGLFSDIWMPDGARYKVTLDDKNIVQKFEADPVIGGLSSNSAKATFDNVAAIVASKDLNIGDIVDSAGRTTKGDGGDNQYEVVGPGSGTVDGGSFIDLTGITGQIKGLFPGGVVNINQFGTDTAAVNAALAFSTVVEGVKGNTYTLTSKVTVPVNGVIKGDGFTFSKGFNGDMFELPNGAKLLGTFLLNGQGGSFTGRGVTIGSGQDQVIECDIQFPASFCVEYTAAAAGLRSSIRNNLMVTTDPENVVAVKYPTETNGDRTLINIDCAGGLLADFAGCSTILVSECNTIGFEFDTQSKKVSIINCRIAGGTASKDVDINGTNNVLANNIIATDVNIQAGCNGSVIGPNVVAGVITDSSTSSSSNTVYGFESSYTPVWTGASTNPVVGNGTLNGQFSREGKKITAHIQLIMGSTTTFGSGQWSITLPTNAKNRSIGTLQGFDAGTSLVVGSCEVSAGGNTVAMASDGNVANYSPTIPHTWANGDRIIISITYEPGA